jgi:hypothetical protein
MYRDKTSRRARTALTYAPRPEFVAADMFDTPHTTTDVTFPHGVS